MGRANLLKGRGKETHTSLRTLADFIREFSKRRKSELTESSRHRQDFILERLSEFFGPDVSVRSISPSDVQRFVTTRVASASSIAHELQVLKRILALAVEFRIIYENPATGIKAPRITQSAPRILTRAEFKAVLKACPPWLQPIVEFSLATGLTQAELLKLRWNDINMKRSENSLLRVSKRGGRRGIPLNSAAQRALHAHRSHNPIFHERIFAGQPMTTMNISQAFRRACRSAGIQDFRFRDLRYTAATWMSERGIGLETVAAYLGHKSLRMAERQLRPKEAELSAGLSVIDSYLENRRDLP
jgi:integrase